MMRLWIVNYSIFQTSFRLLLIHTIHSIFPKMKRICGMADNSKLTLLWEIDNPEEKFATGKVESEVFEAGGFRWAITVVKAYPIGVHFTLRCDAGHNRPWKCEVEAHMRQCIPDGAFDQAWIEDLFCFNENNCSEVRGCLRNFGYIDAPAWLIDGKVVFECFINIINAEGGELFADPRNFDASSETGNVILKIGEKKLHVSKELLTTSSPVFKNMLSGDFVEKGNGEVEIQDVIFEEFVDLILMICSGANISDATVIHLLILADRFEFEHIRASAEEHLYVSKKFTMAEKLRLADLYRLSDLRDNCLQSYSTSLGIAELKPTPEYANFSADMKVAICDRLMELVQEFR